MGLLCPDAHGSIVAVSVSTHALARCHGGVKDEGKRGLRGSKGEGCGLTLFKRRWNKGEPGRGHPGPEAHYSKAWCILRTVM